MSVKVESDEEAAAFAQGMAEAVARARADPMGYLISALWRVVVETPAGLAQYGIELPGEMILGALATCSIWALADVPDGVHRARYLKTFLKVVQETVEERDRQVAEKQRKTLAQSGLH